MIVIAAGYSGTGSSAIVHLLSEYKQVNIGTKNTFEHVLFYIPDGLFDLEDRLLLNNSIHMADASIDRFYMAMKRLYEEDYGWFGGYKNKYGIRFMDIVNDFIEKLVDFRIDGYWSEDFSLKFTPKAFVRDIMKCILGRKVRNFSKSIYQGGDGIVKYSFVSAERFYGAAKQFVKNYIDMISESKSEIIVLDQILLPHNLYRLDRYFENTKAIVFDRDPRDMYILSKYIWPKIAGSPKLFPDKPQDFIKFYKGLRCSEIPTSSKNILRLHFEDLVYRYDSTVANIENFVGLEHEDHIYPQTHFISQQSLKNTQNFRIKPEWEEEVMEIQLALKGMTYNFPYIFIPKFDETSDPQIK